MREKGIGLKDTHILGKIQNTLSMDMSTIEQLTKKLQDFVLLKNQAVDTARNVPLAAEYISFMYSPTALTASSPIVKSKASLLLRWSTGTGRGYARKRNV
jgi:hypothetical protein